MQKKKRAALQAAGFRIGDAEDFLELTDEERRLLEVRFAVSQSVRRLREKQQLTQEQLAVKLKSSQSRVAKIEAAASDVSLDLLFRGLFAVGGGLDDLFSHTTRRGGKVPPTPAKVRRSGQTTPAKRKVP